ncbi:PUA domain-containing protein [Ignicoccus islandicus]|nr:PUA domain-containing protein [Ignicoccus islandicus]
MRKNISVIDAITFIYGVKVECKELEEVRVKYSKTGMPRYIIDRNGKRLFTVRSSDGLLTLSEESAKILFDCLPGKVGKVYVTELPTKTVFNKHVVDADENLLRGVDALIVKDDELIAYGRTVVSGREMITLNMGEAIKVRGKLDWRK